MLQKKFEKGALLIVDEVVKIITAMAFSDISGVEISSLSLRGRILEKVTKSKNILVESADEQITITVKIGVVYRLSILKKAIELQQLIKNHVELFTEFKVKEVHIIVDQIIYEA